ncbi:aminopeptidase N-like isoform X2 [Anthonomus grandis grandis]|uniref:aminopeptidase N-like isoform X2 n=1 Tax=Anthonomus grandis grandis TaxID=2921223 RepID=UPI0021660EAD|nr:aminopeptidase N-like isoform X2 [Anthonomus grandis grandis]
MVKGTAGPFSSRTEFITDDTINDGLRYSRNGGCFVTTKKAIAFVVLALLSLFIVIVLMYYYGPNTKLQLLRTEINDIEQLLNETINEEIAKEDLRLPNDLHPMHYKLNLFPILDEPREDNFTFTGQVKILVSAIQSTNKIVLNWDEELQIIDSDIKVTLVTEEPVDNKAHNITRRQADVTEDIPAPESDDESITTTTEEIVTTEAAAKEEKASEPTAMEPPLNIEAVVRDPENFKLKILLEDSLRAGKTYVADIKFSGNITNNLVGLYRTSYTDLAGNVKWLATTQFGSVYARTVFPCFDEPSFKAQFEISIARKTNMTVLSNMPLKLTEPINDTDWIWDHFKVTPLMSTYLVAFTICDFGFIAASNGTAQRPLIKVWAPKDDLPKAQFALEAAQEILPFLERYFEIKYPLPKLDLVAIPSFGMDAMENWGLIHFRKLTLLFDPDSRSIKTKSLVFAKIAHELAHQWFGNLVTMEWWSDLWLNEGFGTFMAEETLTALRPRWHVYISLQLRNAYTTLYYDSLKSTQSIESNVSSNAQIEQIYETYIVTKKGSSILKMLNYTLTKEVFQKGLHNYLKKFSYKSTNQDDLWGLFTKRAHNQSIIPENVTVKALMNSWTSQSGYPCITVNRNYSTGIATINQTKMTEDLNVTSNELWYVPITYTVKDEKEVSSIWLENVRETELNLSYAGNDTWVLVNIDETGFFRVNYDIHNWNLLTQQLRRNPNKISVSNRGHLIDDAFQLANVGYLKYTVAFNLVKYLNIAEINYIPWYAALRNLEELRVIISNYEYSGLYDDFILKLVKPMFEELGTIEKPNDTQNEKLLRLLVVTLACQLRYWKCTVWTRQLYEQWMKMENPDTKNIINVDYRHLVQCSAIRTGGPEEWDFLWNRTLSPSISPADLETAYLSLGCTYDPWLINRYLEYSLDGNMTLENVQNVWRSINHPVGARTGFQFLRLNWDRIFATYEDIYPVFTTIFHDFVSQLSTEIDLEDLTTFYKLHQNDLKSVANILQSSVDQMKVRIKWKKKHLDSVVGWLKDNKV